MIIDITGIVLTPGNNGEKCLGNGKHFNKDGSPIESCCDECDYAICCLKGKCKLCERKICVNDEK